MKTRDGNRLYYQKWIPEDPKAIIVFVHGLTGHVGRYSHFSKYFTKRRYGVCMFDLRGHGKSTGRMTHIKSFDEYVDDTAEVLEFVRFSLPEVPIFLVGHSMGGQIILNYIVRHSNGIRGVVTLSPNIEAKVDMPEWKVRLGKLGAKYLPILRVSCNVDPEALTHDRKVIDGYLADLNIRRDVTLKCGLEILKNSELMMAMAPRVHTPILMMHGSDDKICDPEKTKKFFMGIPGYNKTLKLYPGLYHELLNETEKDRIFADIETWVASEL